GVGKTSMAAATAVKLARAGKKVLIMSTDQAHSLGDSFDCKVGREATKVTDNLDAMEIDTVYEGEKSWGHIKDYMKRLLTAKGGNGIEAEELLIFPGLEELFSMFKILDMSESGEYDVIIVDCAPTGETLSLLKYPERFSTLIEKVLPMKKLGVKVVGPAVEGLTKIPMPGESVFDDVEYLMDKMRRLQELMLDTSVVSLRVVTTPEKIVISEAKRNFTCLYLYHYNVDAVIVNHVYPAKAMEGYFNKWIKRQEEGLSEIRECFGEVPKIYVELQEQEVRTVENLKRIGEIMFKEIKPDDVLFTKEMYRVDSAGQTLTIYLPFAEKEELELNQDGCEITVGVRNERRRFPVPAEFREMNVSGAKFEDGYLKICFA
ncbi:MAG: ArsA family ATPase, partial [Lachnospiraceae bacterium]|nr:ArsA family ATPase [Lachnospiraceae bacterium]